MKAKEISGFVWQMLRQAVSGNKGTLLQPGTPAPDFSVRDESGNEHRLDQYRGKKVVLWFFPKANTSGWTEEGKGFRDRIQEFQRKNVTVLGVSMDSAEENLKFKRKFEFPFPLLCDVDRNVCLAYGAAAFKNAAFANRISYLIDENGIISRTFARVIPAKHAEELLQLI